MYLEDKKIICKKCEKEFIFTWKEQKFYSERNLLEPKYCKPCKEERREFFNSLK